MDDLVIREAQLEDLDELLTFEQSLVKAERPYDPCIREGSLKYYNMEELIVRDDICLMVAEVEGTLISSGYAVSRPARHYLNHEHYAYLGFMYTKEAYRGMGVNQRIIEKLVEWSRERGLKEVRLTVYDDNLPAVQAYLKAGFRKHIVEMRLASD